MADKLKIWNLSLANIQETDFISDVDEDSQEANVIRVYYDEVRKAALKRHDWNFARKRVLLAQTANDPAFPWAFEYGYPTDCIQARSIAKGSPRFPEIPFETSTQGNQRVILTNQPEACLVYTFDQLVEGHFSDSFVIYLSWEISAVIAMPITNKRANKIAAVGQATVELLIAKSENMNEQRQDRDDIKENPFTLAHGSSSNRSRTW